MRFLPSGQPRIRSRPTGRWDGCSRPAHVTTGGPAHIHLVVRSRGFQTLTTHVFDAESDYLDNDTVFAVKPSLIGRFARRAADDPDRPAGVGSEWVDMELDLVLTPGEDGTPQDPGRTH